MGSVPTEGTYTISVLDKGIAFKDDGSAVVSSGSPAQWKLSAGDYRTFSFSVDGKPVSLSSGGILSAGKGNDAYYWSFIQYERGGKDSWIIEDANNRPIGWQANNDADDAYIQMGPLMGARCYPPFYPPNMVFKLKSA